MLQLTSPVLSYGTCLAVERKSDQADWSRGWPAAMRMDVLTTLR
jgi:hypothetical protein